MEKDHAHAERAIWRFPDFTDELVEDTAKGVVRFQQRVGDLLERLFLKMEESGEYPCI